MAARIIQELKGFSGCQIFLMQKGSHVFVRKSGNINRNVERMYALADEYPLPKIFNYSKNKLDMEYVHGLDIKTYLTLNRPELLTTFLLTLLEKFKSTSQITKDYSQVYKQKLGEIDFKSFDFTSQDLYDRLPKVLPVSQYHGDLTLENILYDPSRGFVLIDCQTTDYDSYIFDIAKLRQDLESAWFVRNVENHLSVKLSYIQSLILEHYPLANDCYLLILMLLRVFRYTKPNTFERDFIQKEIKRLWK